MAQNDEEPGEAGFRRSIRKVRERAFTATMQVRDEQVRYGQVSESTRRELASAALALRDRLINFRGDAIDEEEWAEKDVDWLDHAATRTVSVPESNPRPNRNTKRSSRPALLFVDPERVIQTIRSLDNIARDLGFEAAADSGTHLTQIDEELIEEVEQWRKQNIEA